MKPETSLRFAEKPPLADCHLQVDRILHSREFRNSLNLQQLLQFVSTRALDGCQESLKEYVIGVEALGRKTDFDPKTDPIVRVQIHRLRLKLREYYDGEGRHDPILVEIPKGQYQPRFEAAPDQKDSADYIGHTPQNEIGPECGDLSQINPGNNPNPLVQGAKSHTLSPSILVGTGILCAFAVFATGVYVGSKRGANGNAGASDASLKTLATDADPVKAFWASVVGDDRNPVIGYTDAVFLLDDSNDLFRYRHGASDDRGSLVDPHLAKTFASNRTLVAQAGSLYYENGYTGTGDLEAVSFLSTLFGQMGLQPIVKPNQDVTPIDLRQHSVILIGSSFQNAAVARLMSLGDFRFVNPDSRFEQWRAEILNAGPRNGELRAYHTQRNPETRVLENDFSIFSLQAGIVPGKHIAVLGGLDTTGTEGATLFAISRAGVEQLIRNLSIVRGSNGTLEIPQFQALVRVQLAKGSEVLGASLEAVHKTNGSTWNGAGSTADSPESR
jgi:hypothetical protein